MPEDFNYTVKTDGPVVSDSLAIPPQTTPQMPVSAPQSVTAPPIEHIESVEKVAHDLKRLLGGTEHARLKPEVRGQVEHLSQWTDDYLNGLEAARKISEHATGALGEVQKELSLALDEFLRLESEGGNVATPAQQQHTDDLSKALRRISGLIPVVEATFDTASSGPNDPPDPEVEPSQPTGPDIDPSPMPEGNPDLLPDIPPVDRPEMKTA